jgi:hypothetical protein
MFIEDLERECQEIIDAADDATPGILCAVGFVVENARDDKPDFCDTYGDGELGTKSYEQAIKDAQFIELVQPKKIRWLLETLMVIANGREDLLRRFLAGDDSAAERTKRHLAVCEAESMRPTIN